MWGLEVSEWNLIGLGLVATVLFAELVIMAVRLNSMKSKMAANADAIRAEELVKYEKKRNELEMILKESELEIKAEYEEMLAMARNVKRDQEEKLEAAKAEFENAKRVAERAEAEYLRYAKMKEQYRGYSEQYAMKLAGIANLNVEQIREEAKREVEKKSMEDLALYRSEILEKSRREVDEEAQRILVDAMQRLSPNMPQSVTSAMVKIPDEAMKGRLIGKEGRNIRSFEASTGTTLIIDETPEVVMISAFNPTRREIAKIALEELVNDGRISPATIEAAVENAKGRIDEHTFELGSKAVESLGISNVHSDIVSLLGKLGYHLSLNQDTLLHSIETAKLSAMIAAELKCDTNIAKRIGLFHDIGKVMSDSGKSHALAGADLLARLGESEVVVNAVAAHHEEVAPQTLYATILQIADTLSSTRPGARMEATDGYIQRIRTLENIANQFPGVTSAYVLQAGRELRVIVAPDLMNEVEAHETVRKIRERIEESVGGSIPIKVTLIREQRFTEIAKF